MNKHRYFPKSHTFLLTDKNYNDKRTAPLLHFMRHHTEAWISIIKHTKHHRNQNLRLVGFYFGYTAQARIRQTQTKLTHKHAQMALWLLPGEVISSYNGSVGKIKCCIFSLCALEQKHPMTLMSLTSPVTAFCKSLLYVCWMSRSALTKL